MIWMGYFESLGFTARIGCSPRGTQTLSLNDGCEPSVSTIFSSSTRNISCRYCGNSKPTTTKDGPTREVSNELRSCRSLQVRVTVQFADAMCSEASSTTTTDMLRRPVSLWEVISAPYGLAEPFVSNGRNVARHQSSTGSMGQG